MPFIFVTGDPSIDILRVDIAWPFSLTSTGDLATVEGEENLESALLSRAIVSKGEVPHRPLYGAFDENKQGALSDDTTFAEQRADLLAQYNREDRVTNVKVTVAESAVQPGQTVGVITAGVRTGVSIGPLEVPLG